jgi:hypothetical protein
LVENSQCSMERGTILLLIPTQTFASQSNNESQFFRQSSYFDTVDLMFTLRITDSVMPYQIFTT